MQTDFVWVNHRAFYHIRRSFAIDIIIRLFRLPIRFNRYIELEKRIFAWFMLVAVLVANVDETNINKRVPRIHLRKHTHTYTKHKDTGHRRHTHVTQPKWISRFVMAKKKQIPSLNESIQPYKKLI